jgi:hypothetical protein
MFISFDMDDSNGEKRQHKPKKPLTLKELTNQSKKLLEDLNRSIDKGIKFIDQKATKFIRQTQKKIKRMTRKKKRVKTDKGRSINLNLDEYNVLVRDATRGISIMELMQKSGYSATGLTKVDETEIDFLDEYCEKIKEDADKLRKDDWRAFLGVLQARLEDQLRFRLGVERYDKLDFYKMVREAKKEEILSYDDFEKIDHLRIERNRFLHESRDEIFSSIKILLSAVELVHTLESEIVEEEPLTYQ